MSLTIGLASYTNIPKITVSFTVSVVCDLLTIVFSTFPSDLTTIQVGIDMQPYNIPFATIKTPNCAQNP